MTHFNRSFAVTLLLLVFLLSSQSVLANNHNTNNSQGGGLPDVVKRVELVERVTYAETVGRTLDTRIMIGGTEYVPGDVSKTFIVLTNGTGQPINSASCFVKAWYPDNTLFYNWQPGVFLDDGIYYYDRNLSNTTPFGVYPLTWQCAFNTIITQIFSGARFTPENGSISTNLTFVIEPTTNNTNATTIWYAPFDETSGNTSVDVVGGLNVFWNVTPDLNYTGTSNTGVRFNGTNQYGTVEPINAFFLNTTEELIVCLAYNSLGGNSNDDPFVDHRKGAGDGWEILGADDELRFTTKRATSGAKNHDTLFAFSNSNFQTICLYSSLSKMESYINGAFDKTTTTVQSGILNATTNRMFIGTDEAITTFKSFALDELCIIKGMNLNVSAIAKVYNSTRKCYGTSPTLPYPVPVNVSGNFSFRDTLAVNTSITDPLALEVFWSGSWGGNNTPIGENVTFWLRNNTGGNELIKIIAYGNSSWTFSSITNPERFIVNSTITLISNDTNLTNDNAQDFLIAQNITIVLVTSAGNETIVHVRGGGEYHISTGIPSVLGNLSLLTETVEAPITLDPEVLLYLLCFLLLLAYVVSGIWAVGFFAAAAWIFTGLILWGGWLGWVFLGVGAVLGAAAYNQMK